MADRASKELRAFQAFTKLLEDAQACRSLFVDAGIPCPPSLLRVLGEDAPAERAPQSKAPPTPTAPVMRRAKPATPAAREVRSRAPRSRQGVFITTPPEIAPPAGVPSTWIPVPIALASPESVVLGVLREAGGPMTRDKVVAAVNARGRQSSEGTIGNAGTHLDEEQKIQRAEGMWALREPAAAPVLNGRYVWGDPSAMTHYEVAAWRREAILHILQSFPRGLTRGDLVKQMEHANWVRVSASPDVVKADLDWLVSKNLVMLSRKRWVPMMKDE